MRKLMLYIFLLVCGIAILFMVFRNAAFSMIVDRVLSHTVAEITPQTFDTFSTEALIILDTREKAEYQVSHLEKAIWVGYEDFSVDSFQLPKNSKILTYCSIGYRSEKIAQVLEEQGYKHVFNLAGGIFTWINEGKVVVNDAGPTEDIHPYSFWWGIMLQKGNRTYIPKFDKEIIPSFR